MGSCRWQYGRWWTGIGDDARSLKGLATWEMLIVTKTATMGFLCIDNDDQIYDHGFDTARATCSVDTKTGLDRPHTAPTPTTDHGHPNIDDDTSAATSTHRQHNLQQHTPPQVLHDDTRQPQGPQRRHIDNGGPSPTAPLASTHRLPRRRPQQHVDNDNDDQDDDTSTAATTTRRQRRHTSTGSRNTNTASRTNIDIHDDDDDDASTDDDDASTDDASTNDGDASTDNDDASMAANHDAASSRRSDNYCDAFPLCREEDEAIICSIQ
ncbi:hypothetical protein EDB85DRAFT_1898142 [Lactarius pseudohatsudake]|nr:hypothetical protein EDB85DRAFT_1898142 [Lactarius pseudohatsudake]